MNTILLCFANDDDPSRRLKVLQEEDEGIDRLLDLRGKDGVVVKERLSYATTGAVAQKILNNQQSLILFHFSGHAGSTLLELEDSPGRGEGLAGLLAGCPNLALVFLNGCSTFDHIRLLVERNVRGCIIATQTPVEDRAAKTFSLAFYEALLIYQKTIKQALESARKALALAEPIAVEAIDRGSIRLTRPVTRNQWYFYAPDDEAAGWEWPVTVPEGQPQYTPNFTLRLELFKALRQYDPTLAALYQLQRKLKMPEEDQILWLNSEIQSRLPYPVFEPLRRILAPAIGKDGKWIPIPATVERLTQYVNLYESVVDLLVSTLLAQVLAGPLLRLSENDPNPLPEGEAELLRPLLTEGWSELPPESLVATLKTLYRFVAPGEKELFIPEIRDLARLIDEQDSFLQSIVFFHGLRKQLDAGDGLGHIGSLCQRGEAHLVEFCKHLGFWANYRLESFKTIQVVRFFHRSPEYRHQKVVLREVYEGSSRGRFQEERLKDLWECQSVLLVKIQRRLIDDLSVEDPVPGGFLNIAPLIIDQNAYCRSDNSVFDLYSFHSFRAGELWFKRVASPKLKLLKIKMYDDLHDHKFGLETTDDQLRFDYDVLRDQFSAIHQLLAIAQQPAAPVETVAAPADEDDLFDFPGQ